jgi:MOSC domain-containing protein
VLACAGRRALFSQGCSRLGVPPSIVVATRPDGKGVAGNAGVGHAVTISEAVRLAIMEPCPRSVIITLPQNDLPEDSGIFRTAAQHNAVHAGGYAAVLTGGTIRGDRVTLV